MTGILERRAAEEARVIEKCINRRGAASQQEVRSAGLYQLQFALEGIHPLRKSKPSPNTYHQPPMTTTMLRPPAIAPFLLLLFVFVQGHPRPDSSEQDSVGSKPDLCLSLTMDHESILSGFLTQGIFLFILQFLFLLAFNNIQRKRFTFAEKTRRIL